MMELYRGRGRLGDSLVARAPLPRSRTDRGHVSPGRGALPTWGRILAADGTVLAETRADGVRIYPQETLAGQTIGYATPLTADEAASHPVAGGYQAGQPSADSG